MIIEHAGNVLLVLSMLMNLELIHKYHRVTGGAWRDSAMGRHVMAYMASTAAILMLASMRLILVVWLDHTDPIWFQALRTLVYLTLPAVFVWRRHLIVKAHREELDGRRE